MIDTPGQLPLIICNMPPNFVLKDGDPRNVLFSGRFDDLDEFDAVSANIELSYLKFMD